MRRVSSEPKKREEMRETPRPDKSELARAMQQSGHGDGLSMEWLCDRFDLQEGQRT